MVETLRVGILDKVATAVEGDGKNEGKDTW